jgi:hypothetical protein
MLVKLLWRALDSGENREKLEMRNSASLELNCFGMNIAMAKIGAISSN